MSGSRHRTIRESNSRRRRLLIHGFAGTQVEPAELPPRVYEPRFLPADQSEGKLAVTHMLKGTHPLTWVFTGDGCTQGATHSGGGRNFTEHFAERIRSELRRYHDVVINTGVSGDRAVSLLKTLEWRVLRFKPDVVLILLGLNDSAAGCDEIASFQKALRRIVGRVQESGAVPILQTPNLVPPDVLASRPDLPAYVESIREIAACDDVPLVDHWRHWEFVSSEERYLRQWLAGAHPGVYGHREMLRLICHEFGIYDAASAVCSLEVP